MRFKYIVIIINNSVKLIEKFVDIFWSFVFKYRMFQCMLSFGIVLPKLQSQLRIASFIYTYRLIFMTYSMCYQGTVMTYLFVIDDNFHQWKCF